jgi:threonine 3-dehydrogenase
VSQLIFTSTIAVFGPGLPDPVPDDVHLLPETMYGVTKVGGELLGEYYRRRFGLDFRAIRFPGLISATLPGGGTSDYAPLMYVEAVRTGEYEAFCRPDTRIPLMYMPDGIRALLELAAAPRERLTRGVYNISAFAPTAQTIADAVTRAVPGANITFKSDPTRQAILDSWPRALADDNARRDWGWRPEYDLERMTEELIPKIRALVG